MPPARSAGARIFDPFSRSDPFSRRKQRTLRAELAGCTVGAMSYKASKALMELRVHLCQTSAASKGVREFWAANYAKIKEANLTLPILLRESANTPARLTATYEFGVEKTVDVDGMSSADFGAALEKALKA